MFQMRDQFAKAFHPAAVLQVTAPTAIVIEGQ